MSQAPLILWFRKDLRLGDNPALHAAVQTGQPIIPLFILEDRATRPLGAASAWWLHKSLQALGARLPLVLRRGAAGAVLEDLIAETGAEGVFWNRLYEPDSIARDSALKAKLQARGLNVQSYAGRYLAPPHSLKNKSGTMLKVFTPYWKALLAYFETQPLPAPLPIPAIGWAQNLPAGEALADWQLPPQGPDWSAGLQEEWTPGEEGAWTRFERFKAFALASYHGDRNRPDLAKVSRLSAHLHWGEISIGQLWHGALLHGNLEDTLANKSHEQFLKELTWRDFSAHLLYHFPALAHQNWRPEFDAFPWAEDTEVLERWQRGQTGYPIVDAGMRELWTTGWMHNRVRMIVASFLVKHLLQPWQAGERWFWNTLVDADPATNAASWQWVAGCGADAAPYFRIFNPVTQAEKFDPEGVYIKKWLPELAHLPRQFIAKPWEAPALVLRAAGVHLGDTYPAPIISLEQGRARALDAFARLKDSSS